MKSSNKKNITDILALTPMQEGMLFHYLKEPESKTYFEQLQLTISGEIDFQRFEKAWNFVIQTNEMLRTGFRWEKVDSPIQVILKTHKIQPLYYDFSDIEQEVDESQKKTAIEKVKAKDWQEKFHLQDVPFRVTLCKVEEHKFEMIISNHHILYDGWSTGIILKEFFNAYNALSDGLRVVKPVKNRFKDFIKWIQQQDIDKQETFWRKYLKGVDAKTGLAIKRKQGKEITPGGNLRFTLGQEEKAGLESFIKTYKLTLAALFYSAWGLLLQRYNNCDDVIFGTTVSGRSAAIQGIDNIVGLFINTLPLRIQINAREKTGDLLHQIDKMLQIRQEYEFTSLANIKQCSHIDPSEELFDTIVIIENYPLDTRLTGKNSRLSIDSYSMVEVTHYDLTVSVKVFDDIEFTFLYDREIYDRDTIMGLTNHFRCIVRDIIGNPGKRVIDIEIMSREEKSKILYEFNNTRAEYPEDKTIHQLFTGQASRNPDLISLIGRTLGGVGTRFIASDLREWAMHVTYRELDEKSSQAAGLLIEKGVQPGSIVGIMVERSSVMIIGILAILKAGGIYLPIDPLYPVERIKYMLTDSSARVLLASPAARVKVEAEIEKSFTQLRWLSLQSTPEPSPSTLTSTCQVSSANLAYLIYTSGSSGNPKGILIQHRNVVNFIIGIASWIEFKKGKCILSLTTISFDIFVLETLVPLTYGLKIVIANERQQKDPEAMGTVLLDHRVEMLQLTPSKLELLIENQENYVYFKHVRELLVGGEPFADKLYRRLRSRYRGKVYNLYGPTETTVWSTLKDLSQEREVDIGSPIANTQVYILDRYHRLQPVAVAGELCIGGDGVARGYLNNPELTSERFLYRFYRSYKSYRSYIYKTGDLACWFWDGNIRFLGRIDHQVKIRGFRIEPGEIENQLKTHPKVKQAVVTVHRAENNETYLAAYIVSTGAIEIPALRKYLLEKLPDYMVPAYFIQLEKIPLTPNLKVDRKALPPPDGFRPKLGITYVAPRSAVEKVISDTWKKFLKLDKPGIDDNFFDLGGNSFTLIRVSSRLKETLKRDIPIVTMFNYPTIRTLAQHLSGEEKNKEIKKPGVVMPVGTDIAVIGMAGRFPGAGNINRFWENLKNQAEDISFFNDDELETVEIDAQLVENPTYVKAKGYLAGVDYFDASFFGFTAVEAEVTDPQVRLFHEYAWAALEDAGYVPDEYSGSIGLYAGSTNNFPWLVGKSLDGLSTSEQFELVNLNSDYFSTLVSYKLNLHGPSITVSTACSTSLVAVVMACQALKGGSCHMALAGGIGLTYPVKAGYLYQESMVFSPDGHCRAFDARAKGTVSGNGIGVVVLKPLEQAVTDKDYTYAVIKGTAANNDGKRKVGYTAPSVEGQAEVITAAWQMAGIAPETIGYIETHGTGTSLGDPIEIEGLKQAFKDADLVKGTIPIGSVKTNIGHLDAAAGVAGLIKTVLALKYKQIPASLHFETPNPKIDFENTPFYVNTTLKEWKNDKYPLRAGVSSFGIGGTNAHVVLEEAPEGTRGLAPLLTTHPLRHFQLILLSAKTPTALDKMTFNLLEYFQHYLLNHGDYENPINPGLTLADAAYTLQVGRKTFNYRRMLVCSNVQEAIAALSDHEQGKMKTFLSEGGNKPVIFMFPGQGSQYVNMGRKLYETEPVFRQEMDRCFEILNGLMDYEIKEILYPHPDCRGGSPCPPEDCVGAPGQGDHRESPLQPDQIDQTEIAQPLLVAIEYALAKLLMHWGIRPDAMIGHSIGEYAAACLSGVVSLADALEIAVLRGRLMQKMPPGAMLSVSLSKEELIPLLKSTAGLSLASINSPRFCVVSGDCEAIARLSGKLEEKGYESSPLHTSHAFHSEMMEPILKEFAEKVSGFCFNRPQIPYISNVTGKWITAGESASPAYWAAHLRQTVQFYAGLAELLKKEDAILLEVGPGRTLASFARQHPAKQEEHRIMELLRHPKQKIEDDASLMDKIGQLWLCGVKIDWSGFYSAEKGNRVSLPTYPFEGQLYKIAGTKHPQLEKRKKITDWFYVPLWEKSLLTPPGAHKLEKSTWLVFCDECGLGTRLMQKLEQDGQQVILVKAGPGFKGDKEREFVINPGQESDYDHLFTELGKIKKVPGKILHLWGVTGDNLNKSRELEFVPIDRSRDPGFYSLLNIARAMGRQGIGKDIQIGVVTDNMQEVLGVEELQPEKAAVLGAVKVIPAEYPNIRCCSMDIDLPLPLSSSAAPVRWQEKCLEHILAEFTSDFSQQVIALRGNHRWVQMFKPVLLEKPGEDTLKQILKEKGVYLITGGLGGIGLTLAEFLAQRVNARLILTGRSSFPARHDWEEWLSTHDQENPLSVKIRKLLGIQKSGGEVMVACADAANPGQMQETVVRARERFGPINGVIQAAGIPDGGVIQVRTREMSEKVFDAKIRGTLVLDHIFKDDALDFFVLCSSVSSILAPVGQVAYSAANAFLDAFALYKTYTRENPWKFTTAIDWDAWQGIGMAAEAVKNLPGAVKIEIAHPLLDDCRVKDTNEKIYISRIKAARHWVVDEHRIMGKPTLPGTAGLEMARAAFEDHTGIAFPGINDVYFLTPLRMEIDGEKEVRTLLKKQENGFKFIISSRWKPGQEKWIDHAVGELVPPQTDTQTVKKHDIKEIMAKCNEKEIIVSKEMLHSARKHYDLQFVFGPRWDNIKRINFGPRKVLILLELSWEFAGDFGSYLLHPALLDTAVGYYNRKNVIGEASLPFSYKRLKIRAPLTRRIYSYQEYNQSSREGEKILQYNITIMDEQGRELAVVEEYKRLPVSEAAMSRLSHDAPAAREEPVNDAKTLNESELLEYGLLPREGAAVFQYILGSKLPQVVISTRDFMPRRELQYTLRESAVLEESELLKPRGSMRPRPGMTTPYAAPTNEIETVMAQIWQDFLGMEQVGIDDDFFQLGGDSLKAITITSKIHQALHVKVPLAEIFNTPYIRGLAGYIRGAEKDRYKAIEAVEKKEYYQLSYNQKRLWLIHQLDPASSSYHIPAVITLEHRVDEESLKKAFTKLVTRHQSLRTCFVTIVKHEAVQVIKKDVEIPLSIIDISSLPQAEKERRKELTIARLNAAPFDIAEPPLFRSVLVKSSREEYTLGLTMHHMISDGWSLGVLKQELYLLYEGYKKGKAVELEPLELQYKDFATWHNKRLKDPGLKEKSHGYWRSKLESGLPALELPTGFKRGTSTSDSAAYRFMITGQKEDRLKQLAGDNHTSLFMVMFSIFNVMLANFSGQQDIVCGIPAAGREHMLLQNIIGFFVNTLVLKSRVQPDESFIDLLKRVNRDNLEALQHQDYPLELVLDDLQMKFPEITVFFNMRNVPETVTREESAPENAYHLEKVQDVNFDITLYIEEYQNGLEVRCHYRKALFNAEAIEHMMGEYLKLLAFFAHQPDKSIKDYKRSRQGRRRVLKKNQ